MTPQILPDSSNDTFLFAVAQKKEMVFNFLSFNCNQLNQFPYPSEFLSHLPHVIVLHSIFFFSVIAPFYLEDSKRERGREGERERERERKERTHAGERVQEKALWLLLLYVFSSTWACPMQIGLSQECCLFCLKSSLWSSDLPCLLATAILDSFSLFYLPNIPT